MSVFLGLFVGCFFGYLYVKKVMEKRLYLILMKSGAFKEDQVNVLMTYYRNYTKIQKEVAKKQRESAQKMELDYQLRKAAIQPSTITNDNVQLPNVVVSGENKNKE